MNTENTIQKLIDHHQNKAIVHLQALIQCYSDPSHRMNLSSPSYLESINSMVSILNNLIKQKKEELVCESNDQPISDTPVIDTCSSEVKCQNSNVTLYRSNDDKFFEESKVENSQSKFSEKSCQKKRKKIFEANSPKQKKSYSCKDLLKYKNEQSKRKTPIFKKDHSQKRLNLQVKKDKENFKDKKWEKVVNRKDQAKGKSNLEAKILNPNEVRQLFMRKQLKLGDRTNF